MKEKEPGIILLTKEACKAQWWIVESGNNAEIGCNKADKIQKQMGAIRQVGKIGKNLTSSRIRELDAAVFDQIMRQIEDGIE